MFGVLLTSIALTATPIIVDVGTDVSAADSNCTLREAVQCLANVAACLGLSGCVYDVTNTIEIAVSTVTLQSTLDIDTTVLGTMRIRAASNVGNATIQNATSGQRPLNIVLNALTDVMTLQDLTIIGGV
jgi:hypothetical protein